MLQAYWYITKMKLLTNLAYRFEVFASVGTNFILMLASVFLWKAVYSGGSQQINALSLQDLTTYTILSIMLSSVFVCDVQDTIYYKIREGQIVTDFYRPIPLLACYLADDIGGMLSALINKVAPLFLFAALFFGIPWPSSLLSLLLFIPSCLLSYGILWLLSALVGLIAFWVMELGNMGMVKDSIVRVLSGQHRTALVFPGKRPDNFKISSISIYLPDTARHLHWQYRNAGGTHGDGHSIHMDCLFVYAACCRMEANQEEDFNPGRLIYTRWYRPYGTTSLSQPASRDWLFSGKLSNTRYFCSAGS